MKTGYKVCDAMTRAPVAVATTATIKECAHMMREHDIGSLLIKDNLVLKGIITDEDIVRKIVSLGIDPNVTAVEKHMAKKLITISPEKDIFDALTIMMEEDIRQLPVMDNKRMIGLLTLKDILKIEPELFDLIVDKINIKESQNKLPGNDGICEECGSYAQKLTTRKGALICKLCTE